MTSGDMGSYSETFLKRKLAPGPLMAKQMAGKLSLAE